MNKEKFKEVLPSNNWDEILATYCNDSNVFLCLLLKTVNSMLDKYAPLIQITRKM